MTITNSNNLNAGMRLIKFIIFIISFMFGLTAFLLLAVGSTISTIFDDFNIFMDDHFFTPANLMIFISICLMIVAITGCIGAIKESTMLVNIFGALLFIVFSMELTAAVLAYLMHGQVSMMLVRTMNDAFMSYKENDYVASGIDFLQINLECCGIDSPDDWAQIYEQKDNKTVVPDSCCELMVPNENECLQFFQSGCLMRLNYIIEKSAMLIASGALTVAFVQFLGVICAFMLAKTIRRTKSLRAARRWQLQQALGVMTNPFSFDKQMEANSANSRQYDPEPEYTQMEKSGNNTNANTYLPHSPSVM